MRGTHHTFGAYIRRYIFVSHEPSGGVKKGTLTLLDVRCICVCWDNFSNIIIQIQYSLLLWLPHTNSALTKRSGKSSGFIKAEVCVRQSKTNISCVIINVLPYLQWYQLTLQSGQYFGQQQHQPHLQINQLTQLAWQRYTRQSARCLSGSCS